MKETAKGNARKEPRPSQVRTDRAIPKTATAGETGQRPLEILERPPRLTVQDDPSLVIWFLD
jgi:hypothetical protein